MSKKVKSALDAITKRVLAYRPKEKGKAVKKAKRKATRKVRE